MSYETDLSDALPRCRHGMAPALCTECPYERGFKAGVEAAARVADRNDMSAWGIAREIRALSQPREPTPSHADAPDDECPDCNDGILTRAFAVPHEIPCPTCNGTMKASPAIVAAVEKFIQREDAHAARTHTVLGADGVVRTWAERVADVEARAALPLCPACAGLGVCAGCDGTGRDDGRRHAAWEAVGKAARDATCSCACGLGVCAGCDGTGRA